MSTPDPLIAILESLAAKTALTALVGTNISAIKLAKSNTTTDHPTGIVVKDAGGLGALQTSNVRQPRLAFFCYGPTLMQARQIALTLIDAYQSAQSFRGSDGSRVAGLSLSTEPMTDYEPETQHPVSIVMGSATVRY